MCGTVPLFVVKYKLVGDRDRFFTYDALGYMVFEDSADIIIRVIFLYVLVLSLRQTNSISEFLGHKALLIIKY